MSEIFKTAERYQSSGQEISISSKQEYILNQSYLDTYCKTTNTKEEKILTASENKTDQIIDIWMTIRLTIDLNWKTTKFYPQKNEQEQIKTYSDSQNQKILNE